MTSEPVSLVHGDLLRIERRYVVDGVVTTVTDKGRFAGVQTVGSAEHIVLEDRERKEVRLFPLHAVSEIALVKGGRRRGAKGRGRNGAVGSTGTGGASSGGPGSMPAWDPGVV